MYCSVREVRHPSEVCPLHFMTILKSFYCPVMAHMYTLPWKKLFHLFKCEYCESLSVFTASDELHWGDEIIHWPTSTETYTYCTAWCHIMAHASNWHKTEVKIFNNNGSLSHTHSRISASQIRNWK